MIEDLEKINLLYPRPDIIESIENYRGFITGRFRTVEEAQARFIAIKIKNFASLFKIGRERKMQKCQLILENLKVGK